MKFTTLIILSVFASLLAARADLTVASGGKARCVIIVDASATAAESRAAGELAETLRNMTGAAFPVQTNGVVPAGPAILVGPGRAAASLFPDFKQGDFGLEEYVMRTKGNHLLLAGGRPRGTMYAVCRFLQEQCGARWWTPWAATIPHRDRLRIRNLNIRYQPAFEYRAPYWTTAFDPVWKVHNGANGESYDIPDELGGCIAYKGFAHTFYKLVPPEKYFDSHPEWFSLIKGGRTHERAQLCLTNPQLRDFVVQRVKEWLRESPNAKIVSVTQNDWFGACECPDCKALDDAEGSHAGTMIAFANYIGEKIEPEFPDVAVDTFAYQYTRKPPKTIHTRSNVIVRLCSIECNFREPFDDPSNASFLADLHGWSKICSRLYVWDYVTDFKYYINPHPNWFTLGPNIRLLHQYGVRGIFEEGAYGGYGAEMQELRSWVLAQLMWNPKQDDRALISEFLTGYYGKAATPIQRYLDLMYDASKGFYLACYLRKNPPHLQFEPMAKAEKLWKQAEESVANDPEILARVRLGHLPLLHAWLMNWVRLRRQCWESNSTWPLPESRREVADLFNTISKGVPGKPWTVVGALSEGGLTVEKFLSAYQQDPPEVDGVPPIKRKPNPPPPADIPHPHARKAVDLQENIASLYKPGEFAEIRPDAAASDLRAVWMPGSHKEWAFSIPCSKMPEKVTGAKWQVYAVIRIDKSQDADPQSAAFTAGVYDEKLHTYPANFSGIAGQTTDAYKSYLLGEVQFTRDCEVYIAPAANRDIRAMYIDRVYLIPAELK